ncbi:GerAB/ArcD/ProY family transporter [Desulfotomaculum sp. 1211_IL3151]|uniref:GerAB/ArcD/ProY family transporter n=1 Tax=Desulfotomaculum sp. 1211_IL3151 TaxID=3084055 RepID=UPI002FDA2BA3
MLKEGKIGIYEGFALIFISNISGLFLSLPASLMEDGKSMIWLTFSMVHLVTMLNLVIIILLMKRHADTTIIEASEQILGRYLGILIGLILAAYFIMREAFLFRSYSEAFLLSTLPRTPISIVLITIATAAIVSAHYGVEIIARVARICLTFIVLGIVSVLLLTMPNISPNYIFPLFVEDPLKIIGNSVLNYSVTSEVLVPGLILHAMGGWRFAAKISFWAILCGGSIILIASIMILLTFGVQGGSELTLPFYETSKLIAFGRFLQRMEPVFLLTWAMVGFLKSALYLYLSTVILSRIFKLPDYRPLLWIITLLCFVIAILPPDYPSTLELEGIMLGTVGFIPVLIIPLFLLIISIIRNLGVNAGSPRNDP